MQIDGLVKQTRQYLNILNVGKDIDIIELNEYNLNYFYKSKFIFLDNVTHFPEDN